MGDHGIREKIEEYIQAHLRVNRFSGTVLVSSGGEILVNKGYGLADAGKQIPCRDVTRYWLESISKVFDSMAVFRLKEEGRLDLQDPVANHVPGWPSPWNAVTISHLLTHGSGIVLTPDKVYGYFGQDEPDPAVLALMEARLEFLPGRGFSYCNAGYVVLEIIVARVSGQSHESFLRDAIIEPMKLSATTVGLGHGRYESTACGYGMVGGQIAERVPSDVCTDTEGPWGLVSTTHDLYLLERALDVHGFFSRESLDLMWTRVNGSYGHGWLTGEVGGRRMVGHDGGDRGFATSYRFFPDSGTCVAVLSNYDTAPTARMACDLAAIVFGEGYVLPKERVAIQVGPSVLAELAGTYKLPSGYVKVLTIRLEGSKLFASVGEGESAIAFELFAESPASFFSPVTNQSWEFVRDADGKIKGFTVEDGVDEVLCEKLS
ncbi:MAG: serine hydrolase [Candidatus Coatesbacteria bacterium]